MLLQKRTIGGSFWAKKAMNMNLCKVTKVDVASEIAEYMQGVSNWVAACTKGTADKAARCKRCVKDEINTERSVVPQKSLGDSARLRCTYWDLRREQKLRGHCGWLNARSERRKTYSTKVEEPRQRHVQRNVVCK